MTTVTVHAFQDGKLIGQYDGWSAFKKHYYGEHVGSPVYVHDSRDNHSPWMCKEEGERVFEYLDTYSEVRELPSEIQALALVMGLT